MLYCSAYCYECFVLFDQWKTCSRIRQSLSNQSVHSQGSDSTAEWCIGQKMSVSIRCECKSAKHKKDILSIAWGKQNQSRRTEKARNVETTIFYHRKITMFQKTPLTWIHCNWTRCARKLNGPMITKGKQGLWKHRYDWICKSNNKSLHIVSPLRVPPFTIYLDSTPCKHWIASTESFGSVGTLR